MPRVCLLFSFIYFIITVVVCRHHYGYYYLSLYCFCRNPEQCPSVVSLLAESYNPHVRYGAAMALGIACAGTGLKVWRLSMCICLLCICKDAFIISAPCAAPSSFPQCLWWWCSTDSLGSKVGERKLTRKMQWSRQKQELGRKVPLLFFLLLLLSPPLKDATNKPHYGFTVFRAEQRAKKILFSSFFVEGEGEREEDEEEERELFIIFSSSFLVLVVRQDCVT